MLQSCTCRRIDNPSSRRGLANARRQGACFRLVAGTKHPKCGCSRCRLWPFKRTSSEMSNRTTSGWPLPSDLEFIIIDHFVSDKATLASCSLDWSRWLPPSRKHLSKDVTIMPIHHLTPDPLADFLHVLERSGEVNSERAIGPHVKRFTLDGRRKAWTLDTGAPSALCFLNILRALLSTLPHLTSLHMIKCLILGDTSQKPSVEPYLRPRFELNKLAISQCLGLTKDPHYLLDLICMFSSIGSLSVHQWG